jgi:hypothetical protein
LAEHFFDNTENFQRLLKYDAFSPYKFGANAHYCKNVEVKVAEAAGKSTSHASSSHKRHSQSRRFTALLDFFSRIIKNNFSLFFFISRVPQGHEHRYQAPAYRSATLLPLGNAAGCSG